MSNVAKIACAFGLLLLVHADARAQSKALNHAAPPRYVRGAVQQLPDVLHEVWHNGRFRITIERTASNDFERQLIAEAERMVPTRGLLDSAYSRAAGVLTDSLDLPARWYWSEGEPHAPFALTGTAVQYYSDFVRGWSRGPNPYDRYDPGFAHSASMRYTAGVWPGAAGESTFEVRLDVSIDTQCGRRCGTHFRHDRRILFDATGKILRIEGDRAPLVSAN